MTGDDDLINALVEGARKDYESEKVAQAKDFKWIERYANDKLSPDLQRLKESAKEIVDQAADSELLKWVDLWLSLKKRLGIPLIPNPGEDDRVLAFVIEEERRLRGLPEPELDDDYIDEDEERWANIVAELPHDATSDEVFDAILADEIEHGLGDDDPADSTANSD